MRTLQNCAIQLLVEGALIRTVRAQEVRQRGGGVPACKTRTQVLGRGGETSRHGCSTKHLLDLKEQYLDNSATLTQTKLYPNKIFQKH